MQAATATIDDDHLCSVYGVTTDVVVRHLLSSTSGDRPLAEDLATETWLCAVRQLERDPAVVTLPWLKTVANRRLIDHWRRERRMRERAERLGRERSLESAAPDPTGDRISVIDALDRLSESHRLVLTLRHVEGLTVREMAARLDRTTKSIESLLYRARQEFRAMYLGES